MMACSDRTLSNSRKTKMNKVVITVTGLRDRTPSKIVYFQEQKAITPEYTV